jgi:hypothetical protein
MASRKPYLISGAAIRDYLRVKYKASKSPLAPDELFCLSCRAGRKPLAMAVEAIPNTPKTTRLKGDCERCGASAGRMISNSMTHLFAETFEIKASGHSDA